MEIYKDLLEKTLYKISDEIRKYKHELLHAPDGHLICSKQRGKLVYLQATGTGDTYHRKAITRNSELIQQLARKQFLIENAANINHNIKLLREATKQFRTADPMQVIANMNKAYRTLDPELFLQPILPSSSGNGGSVGTSNSVGISDNDSNMWIGANALLLPTDEFTKRRLDSHRAWAESPYQQNSKYPEELTHVTSRGQRMRSKSEVFFAERLYHYDVPFRYEPIVKVGHRYYAPDFGFEDREHTEFYHEHFGMMQDPDYARSAFTKLQHYATAGILPGKNLTMTFEYDNTINIQDIDNVILNHIIPKM